MTAISEESPTADLTTTDRRAPAGVAGVVAVGHLAAAILHGLPFCHSEIPPPHLLQPAADPGRERRPPTAREVLRLGGLTVTTGERTVVDCAATLPFDHAVMLADAALRQRLVTRGSLQAQLERHGAGPGPARATAVLAFADPRSAGPGESFTRAMLHRWGFGSPRIGVTATDEAGRPVGRIAFVFPRSRVLGVFEPPDPDDRRQRRDHVLRRAGWHLERWWWDDLRRPDPWAERLRGLLRGAERDRR